MPFKSKKQMAWMFSAEERGELPKGTAQRWADHTPNIDNLPERVEKKKMIKKAYDTGFNCCLEKLSMDDEEKTQLKDILEGSAKGLIPGVGLGTLFGLIANMSTRKSVGSGLVAGALGGGIGGYLKKKENGNTYEQQHI